MIIGNGDIASVLPERDDLLFFASGVSNSQVEAGSPEFTRENMLLTNQPRDAHIVYFGSLAVFYSDTPYTWHKLNMEKRIKAGFDHWTIIRIGNIAWGDNPHTLINHFKAHPDAEIRDEYRYITDKEEFLHWIGLIPKWNAEINIPGKRMKVQEVFDVYAKK